MCVAVMFSERANTADVDDRVNNSSRRLWLMQNCSSPTTKLERNALTGQAWWLWSSFGSKPGVDSRA